MILLLALVACVHDRADPCAALDQHPWEPTLEDDVRVDDTTAEWVADGAAVLDAAAVEGCAEAPCLVVTGPGGASLPLALNRASPYSIRGSVTTDTPGSLTVVHEGSDGEGRIVVAVALPVGTTDIDEDFTLEAAGEDVIVTLALDGAGTATLDGFSVVGERWAAATEPPAGPVHLGFLIHVEDNPNFLSEEPTWRLRARIIEGLSGVFAAHGAHLTVQADASFVRGATLWDPDWVAARTAEGVGWSVHIHDEGAASAGIEQAIRDGRTALREAGILTGDLNGGFGTGPWLEARMSGMTSLTAFKDPATQGGLPAVQVQPWRPADGVAGDDPAAFLLDDPEGPLLYLPGYETREVVHDRFPLAAANALSQVLAHAEPDALNTWYYVLHVDGFGPPADNDALEAFLDDGSFDAALVPYAAFLADTTDRLAASGDIVYDTPSGMAATWLTDHGGCLGDTAEP